MMMHNEMIPTASERPSDISFVDYSISIANCIQSPMITETPGMKFSHHITKVP